MSHPLYDLELQSLDGATTNLRDTSEKVALFVNVASACGFTPQYQGLQALHEKYASRGFAVMGFPCNQFGAQEPGSSEEIAQFCESRFSVGFPMFAKLEVNGKGTHPLYEILKTSAPGLLGSKGIKWNFTKFLVGRGGSPITRYAPSTKPAMLEADIEKLLAARD